MPHIYDIVMALDGNRLTIQKLKLHYNLSNRTLWQNSYFSIQLQSARFGYNLLELNDTILKSK